MNENINLKEILKDCPIGWKFYSSVYGDVEFVEIYSKPVLCNPRPGEDEWLGQEIHNSEHPILFDADGFEHRVSSRGEMIKGRGECTFFPSREQRDWSKFTAPWYKKQPEPKFKVGDWVVNKFGDSWHIDSLDKKNYQVSDGKGNYNYFPISKQDEMHIWTIQDAKDSDILAFSNDTIVIFKDLYNSTSFHSYCHIEDGIFDFNKDELPDWWNSEDFKPATKEQSDILFQKIQEACYKWNAETKILEKFVKPKFKVGDKIRHKESNKDDVYVISKVYDDAYGIVGLPWMLYMKYQDRYEFVPNKFDVTTLKPFDKVLVRDSMYNCWRCALYSHETKGEDSPYRYATTGCFYKYCIPYNEDTACLVGTKDEAPEFYRYWEE